jgi:hypothetical protein
MTTVAFAAALFVAEKRITAEEPLLSADAENLIRKILAAKEPETMMFGRDKANFGSLFKLVGDEGLPKLLTHTSDSVAIQAAWEQVVRTISRA